MNTLPTNRSLDRREETLLVVIAGLIPVVSMGSLLL